MEDIINYGMDKITVAKFIDNSDDATNKISGVALYMELYASDSYMVDIVKKDDYIIIYPSFVCTDVLPENAILKIKISDIDFFKVDGEVYHEQQISGGGSGDINLGGAILGDIIGGPAGMVLGGQRKINDIKSVTIDHDDRKVKLSFIKDGARELLYFGHDALEFFNAILPEKEFEAVSIRTQSKLTTNKNNSTKEKMIELKELLDDGLITQEEFDKKKQEILDEIK